MGRRQKRWIAIVVLALLLLLSGLGCNLTAILESEETATVPPSPTTEREAIPTDTPPPSPSLSQAVPLEHAFGGFSLEYPSGWVVDFGEGMVMVAESQEVLDDFDWSTGALMLILSGPPEDITEDMGAQEPSAEGLLDVILEDFGDQEEAHLGDVETRRFASQEGTGVPLWWAEEGQPLRGYLATYLDGEVGIVLLAVSPEDGWGEAWPLFEAIMSSMVFYAPLEAVDRGGIELGGRSMATLDPGGTDGWGYRSLGDEYVTIEVVALGDWDPTVEVFNEAGDSIGFDDDSGGDLNPRLMSLYLPTPGRYEIRVSTFSGYGDYEINLSGAEAPGGGSLTYGEMVESVLEQGERQVWTFEGTAGDVVSISMIGLGDLSDTYLELYAPDGALLTEDDDSGEGYSALIGEYELPQSGTYRIVARAWAAEAGEYELSLEKSP